MKEEDRRKIAALFPGRFDRNYVASKLRTDPLYDALVENLRDSHLPLLDLGCGLGLLAFSLRCEGIEVPIHGVDYDTRKVEMAGLAASRFGGDGLSFSPHDLRNGAPEHLGNVCMLDILQFFDASEQERLLKSVCSRVAPGGKLIIRSGLRDDSMRFKITVLGDLLAKATFWMKAGPTHYPTAEDFQRILSPFGNVAVSPLWGKTPFNNHLVVLDRSMDS
jgi:2-polyprenyl-3-methyl-5-hydroxy-6-metoxy-1,4-benzoquinol methylase